MCIGWNRDESHFRGGGGGTLLVGSPLLRILDGIGDGHERGGRVPVRVCDSPAAYRRVTAGSTQSVSSFPLSSKLESLTLTLRSPICRSPVSHRSRALVAANSSPASSWYPSSLGVHLCAHVRPLPCLSTCFLHECLPSQWPSNRSASYPQLEYNQRVGVVLVDTSV